MSQLLKLNHFLNFLFQSKTMNVQLSQRAKDLLGNYKLANEVMVKVIKQNDELSNGQSIVVENANKKSSISIKMVELKSEEKK